MPPLAALKPPPENAQTIEVFTAVHNALIEIDRAMIKRVGSLSEGRVELIAAYNDVRQRFAAQAGEAGLSDWLEFMVLSRTFALIFSEAHLDEIRAIFRDMERFGYPHVIPLLYTRMIWANMLLEQGEPAEAQGVARLLLDDVPAIRTLYPQFLPTDFDDEIDQFRLRLDL